MSSLYVDFDDELPRYGCDSCDKCNSLMGQSLCSVKNRGCCWYFPKFNLLEIQRMSLTLEGLKTLKIIIKNPNTTVYKYYIHSKGFFDKEGYEEYLNSNNLIESDGLQDHSIFFRACPFVKEGYGCTIPAKYRSYICNFFICKDVTSRLLQPDKYEIYKRERDSYVKWIHWENENLEYMLKENNLNLIDHWQECLELLRNTPMEHYEFPKLEPIIIGSNFLKDA